jgi:pyrimidine operon attenuation protein/uracil phosphoribosyltransferase
MARTKTLLLDHNSILQKINRMAWEVYESNTDAEQLILVGVAQKGSVIRALLAERLQVISPLNIIEADIFLDKDAPEFKEVKIEPRVSLTNERVILVDDVLNSGKTMMYATLPLLKETPHKLQTCVLANRDHKRFPIHADFVGISLSTTLQEHISFEMKKDGQMSVHLS